MHAHLAGPLPGAQGRTFAVFKSEQNVCRSWGWFAPAGGQRRSLDPARQCTLALRLATAPSAMGPFTPAPLGRTPLWTDSISRQCAR